VKNKDFGDILNLIVEFESIENIEKNKMEEGNWIPVFNFPDYIVSNLGHIKEIKSGKILKEHKDEDGYLRVLMSDGERKKLVLVHFIVYFSFSGLDQEFQSIQLHSTERRLEEEMLEKIDEEDVKEIFNSLDGDIVH